MSALATCRGWCLFFDGVNNNSRSETHDQARGIAGLDWLVESGNDPGDYSFTTISIGKKKLPVELSGVWSVYVFVCRAQSDH